MNPASRVEEFIREVGEKGYKKIKETPNTLHFKKIVPQRNEEFHLIIRPNRHPMDFHIHKDNYLVMGRRNEPIEKTSTSLKDKILRDEFAEIASIFLRTNPRNSFALSCPICGCNMNYAKLPKHIDSKGCSPGFGGMLSTLWKLDQEKFGSVEEIRKYYSDKYGVESRTELSTEQLKEEINIRRVELKREESVSE